MVEFLLFWLHTHLELLAIKSQMFEAVNLLHVSFSSHKHKRTEQVVVGFVYLQTGKEKNDDTKASVGIEPTRSHPVW